jgi:hypothetical protein
MFRLTPQDKEKIKLKIYGFALNYLHTHNLINYDRFVEEFTEELIEEFSNSSYDIDKIFDKTKGHFLKMNNITREQFLNDEFKNTLIRIWNLAIIYSIPICQFQNIFPEISRISDIEIKEILEELEDLDEDIIQNALRDALREKGAFPISRRGRDSSLEVAEPEHFEIEMNGKIFSFTAIVKGYKNRKGKLSWKEIAHQITRAYRTHPDYILVMSAREPVDGFITDLKIYSRDVGNSNLVIFIPPMDLAKFLLWRKVINQKKNP